MKVNIPKKRQSIVPALNLLFLAVVLIAFILPKFALLEVMEDPASVEQCCSNLRTINKALSSYRQAHGGKLPEDLRSLVGVEKGLLLELPACPTYCAGGVSSVSYGISKTVGTDSYTLYCCGQHRIAALKEHEPYYSSQGGIHPNDQEVRKIMPQQ